MEINPSSILFGLVLLITAFIILLYRRSFRKKAIYTKGKVIDIVKDGEYFMPIVEFQTKDGKTYQVQSRIGTKPSIWKEGDSIDLYYDLNNPEKISISSRYFDLIFFSILIVLGLFFTLIGLYSLSGF